jgi:glycosyltransferase involved in cell wall biosynthesis
VRDARDKFILVVQTTVPVTVDSFFKGQLKWLSERGVDVHVVSSPGAALAHVAEREGICVHEVPMKRRVTPFADIGALFRLVALYRRLRPDVVHGFTPKGGLLAMIAARIAAVPVRVYTILGLVHTGRTGLQKHLMCLTERLSCRLANRVYCECSSILELAVREQITPARKASVLPAWNFNSIADILDRSRKRSEYRQRVLTSLGIIGPALVIGFVGRIVPDKGIAELVHTHQILVREFPSLRLLLVGSPEKEQPLNRSVWRYLDSTPQVHCVGFQADPVPYLAAMDVLLLPSYREGLPTVPLEAAAMGLPVVTTDIPGCVDALMAGETGFIVPAHDSAALTDATRTMLASQELRVRMGTAGRDWVSQKANTETTWHELLHDYRQLLNEHAGPSLTGEKTNAQNYFTE